MQNKNLKIRKIVLALLIIPLFVHAQIDVPVDLLTGRPVVSLPIASIGYGSISAGVSVSYDGGGYHVGDSEGSAGVNWSLIAGGQIYREVKGLPDDLSSSDARKGWNNVTQATSVHEFAPAADISSANWYSLNGLIMGDTEPDIFYVNAPGLSCSFVFDQNGNIQLLTYQNIKIVPTIQTSNDILSFLITNDQGITYHFSSSYLTTRQAKKHKTSTDVTHFKKDYDYYKSRVTFCNNWDLTEIRGVNSEVISFGYETDGLYSATRTYVTKVNTAMTGIDTLYYINDNRLGKNLVSIESPFEVINLEWNNKIISRILVRELKTNTNKKFAFIYSDVRNAAESTYVNGVETKRVSLNFLSGIQVITNCKTLPSFRFEYHGVDLSSKTTTIPIKNQYPKDLWGYFNQAIVSNKNTILIPQVYQNSSATNGERFRISPKVGWAAIGSSTSRNINPNSISYGALKLIRYPTGGYAEINYEPASYYDAALAADVMGGGLRVASVNISSEQVRRYEYKQANGISSGKWTTQPAFAFADGTGVTLSPENLNKESMLLYERVSVIQPGRGKTVFTHRLPAMYNVTSHSGVDWSATKTKLSKSSSGASNGNVISDFYTYPFAPNTSYDFERGLISQVEEFMQSGHRVSVTANNYMRFGSPVRVKAIRFDKLSESINVFGQYELLTNVRNVLLNSTTSLYDSADQSKVIKSTTSYRYTAKGYPFEVSTTNSDGNVNTSGTKYSSDYMVSVPSGLQATLIQQMNSLNMLTVPIESYTKFNSTITNAQLFLYDNVITGLPYIKQKLTYSGTGAFALSSVSGDPQTFTYESTRYRVEQTFEDYNDVGFPISFTDYRNNTSSILYGFNQIPAVVLKNARINETVFADFEHTSSSMIGSSANFVKTEAWSGSGAGYFQGGTALLKNGIKKGIGRYYRFSCWVKTTTIADVTIAAQVHNGSSWVTYNMVYPVSSSGKWRLMETRIDMNGIPSVFNFQISGGGVYIDDVSFYPETAEYVRNTYHPSFGKTSTSNTNNQYSFTDYDELGRTQYTRNTDKHIIQAYEYQNQEDAPVILPASFYCHSNRSTMWVDTPIEFRAYRDPCSPPLTYSWKVDGVAVGSNSASLVYTFPIPRKYVVELTTFSLSYPSSNLAQTFEIFPSGATNSAGPLAISITTDNNGPVLECDDPGTRDFTVSITGCVNNPIYSWYYFLEAQGIWVQDTSAGSATPGFQYTFSFSRLNLKPQAFSVQCVVSGYCQPDDLTEPPFQTSASDRIGFGFRPQPRCR